MTLGYEKLKSEGVVKILKIRFINIHRVNPSWKPLFLLCFSIGDYLRIIWLYFKACMIYVCRVEIFFLLISMRKPLFGQIVLTPNLFMWQWYKMFPTLDIGVNKQNWNICKVVSHVNWTHYLFFSLLLIITVFGFAYFEEIFGKLQGIK